VTSDLSLIEPDVALEALEHFVVDNGELEDLESLLGHFNLFGAIGVVRQELRHSDFLAFLLDPSQNHGLGDAFAKRLLQRALAGGRGTASSLTPVELDTASLIQAEVRREWQNIDILLVDEPNRLAVIIENKVDSGEHSGQLIRYWDAVTRQYPNHRTIGLFLTPDGDTPTDERYVSIDYSMVCDVLDRLLQSRSSTIGPEVRLTITHYVQMLRRHVVTDSQIADLCRRIYQKHKQALDLIYEHRPDQQQEVADLLKGLIGEAGFRLTWTAKRLIDFIPPEWDIDALDSHGLTASGRVLILEFDNSPGSLTLRAYIGPGPEATRRLVFDIATQNNRFSSRPRSLSSKWISVHTRPFLTPRMYQEKDTDEIREEVIKRWHEFRNNELPPIIRAVVDGIAQHFSN
jgi:hypothetical protein